MKASIFYFIRKTLPCSPRIQIKSLHATHRHSTHVLWHRSLPTRALSTAQEIENINVGHSQFLADKSSKAKWADRSRSMVDKDDHDAESMTSEGMGKLSPTSSHLFKLIIPLPNISSHTNLNSESGSSLPAHPPTVFLLHPSQPLSHVSRLILASFAPARPHISFRSTTPSGRRLQWSDSTDVGDFVRDAARTTEFEICIMSKEARDMILRVEVPSFADRTRFLRRKLEALEMQLHAMEGLKNTCDDEAHWGAKRMALGGFGMLVAYWGIVARLTFWDYGWDFMEPITYLSGLSTVVLGYLWFLYQGHEVSYSSVLNQSISTRRGALYKARGLDIEQWMDLIAERRSVRKEINRIAEDYDEKLWRDHDDTRKSENQEARESKDTSLSDANVLENSTNDVLGDAGRSKAEGH